MKLSRALFRVAAAIAGLAYADKVAASSLIVPGHGVGRVFIGQEFAAAEKVLGPATESDAAMGHSVGTWRSKSRRANVLSLMCSSHAAFPDGRPNAKNRWLVQEIRFTSPWFRTKSGIRAGARLARISKAFPHTSFIRRSDDATKPRIDLYDDINSGIAFEIRRSSAKQRDGVCTAVIIHPRKKGVGNEYLPFFTTNGDGNTRHQMRGYRLVTSTALDTVAASS